MTEILEKSIERYLTDPRNGLTTATRVEARRTLGKQIGRQIFLGRLRRERDTPKYPFALLMRRIATRRFDDLPAEPTEAQAVIEFVILGKSSPILAQELCEKHLRLALVNYTGNIGTDGTIYGSSVERDGMVRPSFPVDASEFWQFMYSLDMLFTFKQD